MDKATVKLVLESYRSQDAHDKMFAEALREVAADPELAAWFEEMQLFDAVMREKFQDLPVPPDVKSHILLGYRTDTPIPFPSRSRRWLIPSSIAALLMVGLFSWYFMAPRQQAMSPLELQAISYTDKMPPLQFVCFDAAAVVKWVNEQPGSQKVNLRLPVPDKSLSMGMIGSSVVNWNGRPVVMVCLQNGKQMAMLYILNANDAPELKEGVTETLQNAGWVVRATKSNGQVRLLAAKGGPENLNFPTPF